MLNSFHLAFQATQLGRVPLVAPNEEQRGPENHDPHGSHDCVFGCLLILDACGDRRPMRDSLRLFRKLAAVEAFVRESPCSYN